MNSIDPMATNQDDLREQIHKAFTPEPEPPNFNQAPPPEPENVAPEITPPSDMLKAKCMGRWAMVGAFMAHSGFKPLNETQVEMLGEDTATLLSNIPIVKRLENRPALSACLVLFESVCVTCLLYTSPSPRDATLSRMPSSA